MPRIKTAQLMGKIVLVDKVYERKSLPRQLGLIKPKKWEIVAADGRPGWVVGERWLQNGRTELSYSYDDPPVWRGKERIHAILVAYWPTMKPVPVPPDGYRLAPPDVRPFQVHAPWPERCREALREDMKNWPRDEKGRWVRKK